MSRFITLHHGLRIGALLSLTLLGCVPPTASNRPRRVGRTPFEISRAEVEAESMRFMTAYELVKTLRPSMFVTRGVSTQAESPTLARPARRGIRVYLDGIETAEIIDTVHNRRPPMISASAGLMI